MQSHQNSLKNRLYQVNQELTSYERYEIDMLMEIIDIVVNMNNRITAVRRELLNRTLYCYMEQVQNHQYSVNDVRQIMLYVMIISEQHLSIYKVLVHKLENS